MKFQLVIFSALLISAFALPVPDEEVSPQQSVVSEVKSEVDPKPEVKVVDVKPEVRSAADENTLIHPADPALGKEAIPYIALSEEKKLELAAKAPDAEITQSLPDKKEDKPVEKQVRAEQVAEPYAVVPVVDAPVAAVEATKQIIDETKPSVQDVQPAGKSADLPVSPIAGEQPLKETIVENAVAAKSEIVPENAVEAAVEDKKEETAVRQERRGVEVETVQNVKVEEKIVENVPVETPVEVVPVVKSLKAEESHVVEVSKPIESVAVPVPEAKSAPAEEPTPEATELEVIKIAAPIPETAAKKVEEPQAAAGDIPQQSSEELAKSLPQPAKELATEAQTIPLLKPDAAPAPASAPAPAAAPAPAPAPAAAAAPAPAPAPAAESKKIEEPATNSAPTEIKQETKTTKEEKKSEEKPSSEEKSSESKKSDKSDESKESEESKDSGESKEEKSD